MIHQKSTHITRETNWKVGLESIYQENWKKSKSQIFPFDCGYLTWVKWASVVTLVPLSVDTNRHTSICTAFPHHLQTIRQRTDRHTNPSLKRLPSQLFEHSCQNSETSNTTIVREPVFKKKTKHEPVADLTLVDDSYVPLQVWSELLVSRLFSTVFPGSHYSPLLCLIPFLSTSHFQPLPLFFPSLRSQFTVVSHQLS